MDDSLRAKKSYQKLSNCARTSLGIVEMGLCVAQAGLKLVTVLLRLPESWAEKCGILWYFELQNS